MSRWAKLTHPQRVTAVNDVAKHLSGLGGKANTLHGPAVELEKLLLDIERGCHIAAPDELKRLKPVLAQARKALKRLQDKTIRPLMKAATEVKPLQQAELKALHQLETEGGIWTPKKGSTATRGAINF